MPKNHDAAGNSPSDQADRLLAADEPPPFVTRRRKGRSSFVIMVDHASRRIPRCLGTLGLSAADLERHIAWDIGSLAVAEHLSDALDAPLVAQNYSRLVIDCNRPPSSPTSIPLIGEDTPISGNHGLSGRQIEERRRAIFDPYHQHVSALLDERRQLGQRTILIALHSMTDLFKGVRRLMQAAVMFNRDSRFGLCLQTALRRDPALLVTANEPYAVSDETDFSLPVHGEARGLPHVGIEMRQDLVADEADQKAWADRLGGALQEAENLFWVMPALG